MKNTNTGDYNSGDYNSGDYNSGYYNSGDYNSGNYNSGDYNSGYYNSGYRNSGYYNSGYRNSGYRNSGDYNSGDYNSGYYNSGDYNSGWFNTNEPKMRFFNKDSDYTQTTFREKWGYQDIALLTNRWINKEDMSDDEKSSVNGWDTMGGYLKTLDYKEAWAVAWKEASKEQKDWYMSLPNFDADIFYEITGVNIKEDKQADKKKKEMLKKADELIKKAQELKEAAENL